jgi:hypothetical protein
MTRRLFLAGFGAGSTILGKSWEQPVFPDWKADFVDRMLTDSPWAKAITVTFRLQAHPQPLRSDFSQIGMPPGIGLPRVPGIPGVGLPGGSRIPTGGGQPRSGGDGDGGGSRAEMYLTTRWRSALPIRQALAIQEFGRAGLDTPAALELLKPNPAEHVVEIFGFPTIVFPQGGAALEKQLLKTVQLNAGSRYVRATSVEVPEHGMHLRATLRFPRIADLTAADGVMRLTAQAGSAKIEQQFKLKPMLYRGELEL